MTKSNATPGEIERLLFHMRTVGANPIESWGRDFARSIGKQAHRKNWRPTVKQHGIMTGLVEDLFSQITEEEEDLQLIES